MARRPAALAPVRDIPSFAVIIRACGCRGQDQRDALDELYRRRLWLSADQVTAAGVSMLPHGEYVQESAP